MNTKRPVKYILVTGGVVSSLGKGLAAASIGALLEEHGYKVALQKFDPYINVDPGTMSPVPARRGVCHRRWRGDGSRPRHYERFTNQTTTRLTTDHRRFNCTVIQKERRRRLSRRTVQVIPHITNEIKDSIRAISARRLVIVEIGGTVGRHESQPFLEASGQLRPDVAVDNTLYIP